MKQILLFIGVLLWSSCQNFGQLIFVTDLPKQLKEVSGNETFPNSEIIWMINDSGNASKIYGVSKNGEIFKEVLIDKKNKDWEDLTTDKQGNLYIGDFGNNKNKRKNLRILKITSKGLQQEKSAAEKIVFDYENQKKFPPKKEKQFFDAEAFFYFNNHFYIFTKSRVKGKFGQTFLYKIPSKKGKHKAKLIGQFYNGDKNSSWITSADISEDGKKVALLSQKNILIFSDFDTDDFFSGNLKKIPLTHHSQKEGICFKDSNTLLITDEKTGFHGRNLYALKIE